MAVDERTPESDKQKKFQQHNLLRGYYTLIYTVAYNPDRVIKLKPLGNLRNYVSPYYRERSIFPTPTVHIKHFQIYICATMELSHMAGKETLKHFIFSTSRTICSYLERCAVVQFTPCSLVTLLYIICMYENSLPGGRIYLKSTFIRICTDLNLNLLQLEAHAESH